MTPGNSADLDAVLARIDAEPIADVEALAGMSLEDIERELARLGVDADAEYQRLLAGTRVAPPLLARMSAAELEALSVSDVERCLAGEDVDVRAWLARAEDMIRRARSLPRVAERREDSVRRTPLGGGGGPTPAPSRAHRHARRRRFPQALAASLVALAIGGVTFSLFHNESMDGLMSPDALTGEPFARDGLSDASRATRAGSRNQVLKKDAGRELTENEASSAEATLAPGVAPMLADSSTASTLSPPTSPPPASVAQAPTAPSDSGAVDRFADRRADAVVPRERRQRKELAATGRSRIESTASRTVPDVVSAERAGVDEPPSAARERLATPAVALREEQAGSTVRRAAKAQAPAAGVAGSALGTTLPSKAESQSMESAAPMQDKQRAATTPSDRIAAQGVASAAPPNTVHRLASAQAFEEFFDQLDLPLSEQRALRVLLADWDASRGTTVQVTRLEQRIARISLRAPANGERTRTAVVVRASSGEWVRETQ